MTQDKNKLFYKQDYLIVEDLYPDPYLQKIRPFLQSLDYELFIPPKMQQCHMYRLMNATLMNKIKFILINQNLNELLFEVFKHDFVLGSIRLTKYTAENKDFLDFHNDYDDNIRLAVLSVDLTFTDNCDSRLELFNRNTDQTILSNKAGTPGRVTLLRIDKHLMHRVTPTSNEDRYALTAWIIPQ